MGMIVINGKLEFYNKNYNNNIQQKQKQKQPQPQPQPQLQPQPQIKQNNILLNTKRGDYIYNKYFKNNPYVIQQNNNIKQPKNIQEYKNMLIQNIINKINSKKQKSTKLLLINNNNKIYSFKHNNVDRLFSFSQHK
jgi:hypothetical protein